MFQNVRRADLVWKKLRTLIKGVTKQNQEQVLTINGQWPEGQCLANVFNDYVMDLVDSDYLSNAVRHTKTFSDSLVFFSY